MKKNAMGRRVVIVNRGGEGNIEQAIFILKKDVKEQNEDYILDEAKKIVDEFVARNGMLSHKGLGALTWLILGSVLLAGMLGFYVYMLF